MAQQGVLDTLPDHGARPASAGRHGRYEVRGVLGSGGMGIVLEAFDPALERTVALKLLHPQVSADAPGRPAAERLIREARAMAKLAHPNVVAVYEAGWSGDQIYLAMELVTGVTLRAWLTERPRRWHEIVATFVAAGRGLVAAHAAGMVHRDFKPENVLIGADGRPRVTDFGLVLDAPRESSPDVTGLATRTALAGTPAYMSPEQWNLDRVGPASDQFSFCVALWEALAGERPFTGTAEELRAAVSRGVLPERPATIPPWLDAALRRGLAPDPAARWSTLAALLDQLEMRTRRARKGRNRARLLAGAGALGAGITAAVAWVASDRSPPPCPPPDARVATVWSPARLATFGPRLGPQRESVLRQIKTYVEGWRTVHVDACRATHVRGDQSDVVLDARMRCLDRRLDELDATLTVLTTASTAEELDHAIGAVFHLTPIDACSEAAALRRELSVPIPPGRSTEIAALERIVQQLEVEIRAERLTGVDTRAAAAVAAARGIGHAPTLASALHALAEAQLDLSLHTEAERSLRELIQVAASIRDDRAEVRAWNHLIFMLGYARGDTDQALALEPAAAAALGRAGNPLDLRVEHEITIAQVLDAGPRVAEAISRLLAVKRVLDALDRGDAPPLLVERRIDVLAELGNAYSAAGDHPAAIVAYREALAGYRELWGHDTLDETMVLNNLGNSLRRMGKTDEAIEVLHDAVRIIEVKTGRSVRLAIAALQLGYAHGEKGDWSAALVETERAAAIAHETIERDDPAQPQFISARALALGRLGRLEEARAAYAAALALFEAGELTVEHPIALVNLGDFELEHGTVDNAERAYTRSVKLFERTRTSSTSYLLYPLVGLGRVHQRQRRFADARAVLERAIAITPDDGDRAMAASARAWLGRALVALGDRARGRELTTVARDALRSLAATDATARQELELLDRED